MLLSGRSLRLYEERAIWAVPDMIQIEAISGQNPGKSPVTVCQDYTPCQALLIMGEEPFTDCERRGLFYSLESPQELNDLRGVSGFVGEKPQWDRGLAAAGDSW